MRLALLCTLFLSLTACGGSDLTVGIYGGDGYVEGNSNTCERDGSVTVGVGWYQPVGDNGGVSVGYGDGSCR